MASLHPGIIFSNPGFNKRSTPLITNENIPEKDYSGHSSKTSHESQALPRLSPVSRIYDVSNSSSRLILLNNKLLSSSKGSRLRGQTDYKGDIKHPDPTRHFSASPHSERHKKCWPTTPEREQVFPPITASASPSSNYESKASFPSKKSTGKRHSPGKSHETCQADHKLIKLFERLAQPPALPTGRRYRLPSSLSSVISDANLRHGERHYLSSIAEIYGVEHIRQQKFQQYNQLLWRQLFNGQCNLKNVDKYFKYMSKLRYAAGHASASQHRPQTSPSKRRSRSREKQHKDRAKKKSPLRTGTQEKKNHDQREVKEKKIEVKRTECTNADSNHESEKKQSLKTIHKSNKSSKAETFTCKEKKPVSKFNDSESQQQSKICTKDCVESSQINSDSADDAEEKDVRDNARNRKDSFFDEHTESISKKSDQKEHSNVKNDKAHETKSDSYHEKGYESEKDSSSSDSEQDDKADREKSTSTNQGEESTIDSQKDSETDKKKTDEILKENICTSDEDHSNSSDSDQEDTSKVDSEKCTDTDQEKQSTINLEKDPETDEENKDEIDETDSTSSDSEQEDEYKVHQAKEGEDNQGKEHDSSKVKDLNNIAASESETNGPENSFKYYGEMTLKNVDDSAAKEEKDDKEKRNGEIEISDLSSSTEDSSLDSSFDSTSTSDDSDSETEPQSAVVKEHM